MNKNVLPLKRKLPFSLLIAAIIAVLLTLTTFGISLFAHAYQIPRTQLPSSNTDAVYSCPTFIVAGDDAGGTQTWNATTSDELQLTIKDQHTGQVVTNMESHLYVLIYYRYSPKVQQVKVMGLYDPVEQSINFHYGTNMPLDRQNIDRVVVTINGRSVTFSIAT